MRTGILIDAIYEKHLTGEGHPERPGRAEILNRFLQPTLQPRLAIIEELAYCHTPEYIALMEKEVKFATTLSTGDVQVCPESYEVARLAAGGVLVAVDAVMQGSFDNAFCGVRPPGHHACSNKGMGFCLFNNVAIGARYVQKKYGVKKILIVDWDVHHGNGTQEIFEKDPSVMYFSTHQWPLYPGTGAADEVGVGNIINCPIAGGPGSRERVFEAVKERLIPAAMAFNPEVIFISAGFDAHKYDPLGGFDLTAEDFGRLTALVKSIGVPKIISVLEGGYSLEGLALSVAEHLKELGR